MVGLEEGPTRETGAPLHVGDQHFSEDRRLPFPSLLVERRGEEGCFAGEKKKKGAPRRSPAGAPPARHALPAAP